MSHQYRVKQITTRHVLALKENLTDFWSRRIDDTNRLVYAVDDTSITILSCRYHY
ncbi:hypothetical protein BZG06_15160 [Salinivibrio kushneri]|uniref:Putative mRNA interferase YoeB n=1 Tax=Salinivibrio kushneri TaxID=1908198 RepID=A0AB36K5C5_9GAMM|nr:hypothetical protein BZG06_15160 [Salinivibrio kushneri]OOE43099.1 hypothetical protein BZG09_11745 [Salinivibrio kushneri]